MTPSSLSSCLIKASCHGIRACTPRVRPQPPRPRPSNHSISSLVHCIRRDSRFKMRIFIPFFTFAFLLWQTKSNGINLLKVYCHFLLYVYFPRFSVSVNFIRYEAVQEGILFSRERCLLHLWTAPSTPRPPSGAPRPPGRWPPPPSRGRRLRPPTTVPSRRLLTTILLLQLCHQSTN